MPYTGQPGRQSKKAYRLRSDYWDRLKARGRTPAPSPEEIKQRCAEIRETWGRLRLGEPAEYEFPVLSLNNGQRRNGVTVGRE